MSLSRFEDRLLSAGRADAPTAFQKQAARRALMGAAFGATVATATTASAAKGAAVGSAKAIGLLKLVAVVGIGLGATAATYRMLAVPPPAPLAMELPAAHQPAKPTMAAAAPVPSATVPSTSIDALPSVAAEDTTPIATPGATDVAEETHLLAAARDCNAADDLACSAERLAVYAKRFPHGQLADEAELVSIDRLRRAGDLSSARTRLDAFLARNPRHPFARQLAKRLESAR